MNEGIRRLRKLAVYLGIIVGCLPVVFFLVAGELRRIGLPELLIFMAAGFGVWAAVRFVAWVVEGFTTRA